MDERQTVREGYDAVAETYTAERSGSGADADLAAEFAGDLPAGSRVLSAGVGAGGPATEALVDRHEVVGLDLSRGQLDLLGERLPDVAPVQGDLTDLPFAADSFDALASSHAVIHVPRERHAEVFAEFHRVLRAGGEAFLVVGNGAWEGRNPDWLDAGAEMVWSFWGRETNLELLRETGFTVDDWWVVGEDIDGDGEWCVVRATA